MSSPNPGSAEAREAGCKCPVIDNNYGEWAPAPPDGWWINAGCPLHGHPNFECPVCHAVSFNPNDVEAGYCGRCHDFTGAQENG